MESESRGKANLSEWENYWNPDAPRQTNTSDCGVFTCKTAEVITRGGELTFRAEEIPNQRHRMIIELVNARLLSTDPDDPESE
jgi:Ulp1 family protease